MPSALRTGESSDTALPRDSQTRAGAPAPGRVARFAARTRKDYTRRYGLAEFLIVLFSLLAAGASWIVAVEHARYDRDQAAGDAVRQNANFALAFEEHIIRTIKGVDHAVRMLKSQYEQNGPRMSVSKLVDNGDLDDTLLNTFGIADEYGNILFAKSPFAPTTVADRQYFKIHQQEDNDALFISRPVRGRLSGKSSIPMARRINKADGSFGGVAFVGVDTEYFTSFYQRLDIGREGMIMLAGVDGIILGRRTGDTHSVGQDLSDSTLFAAVWSTPIGNVRTLGKLDNISRYVSYRTLRDYPLVVAVGSSEKEALAASNARGRIYYQIAALGSTFLVLFAAGMVVAMSRQRRARYAAAASETRFRSIFDQAAAGIVQSSLDLRILATNPRFCEMLGYRDAELVGKTIGDITHPDDLGKSNRFVDDLLAGASPQVSPQMEKRYLRRDGSVLWVTIAVTLVRDMEGDPDHLVTIAQDVTQRKEAEQALHESKEQFQQLADHIPEAFWITDARTHGLIYLSPAYERISGRPFPSLRGAWRTFRSALHPEDRPRVLAAYRSMGSGSLDEQYRLVRPDGTTRWVHARGYPVRDADGSVYRVAGTIEDITERRELERRLQYQAHFDSLTSLPNRLLFFDRLGQAVGHARRRGRTVSLLFLDLDRFKVVNDTLGHVVGDQLLQHVSQRLLRSVRAEDTVARLGGDEFAMILSDVDKAEDAAPVAQKALKLLAQPFQLDGHEVFLSASIGLASFPGDGDDAQTLVKNADAAMFRAKLSGGNMYEFYTAAMNERALEKLQLESELRRALERREFLLHFQPRKSLASGRLTGCEALLRWQRPDKGLVPPKDFIPLLEDSGLIRPVGEWVIREACAQIAQWRRAGLEPLPVAVNLSAKQFQHQDIQATVEDALRGHGVDPRLIELEITESAAMQNADETIVTLRRLKQLGLKIAIDDFGTGHSSLSYLKRLPIDVLKIDRSFIIGLPANENDASIVRAIITMAHSLGLTVIAEGVELEEQLAFLAANNCDEMQGYLLSRPVPAHEISKMLASGAGRHVSATTGHLRLAR